MSVATAFVTGYGLALLAIAVYVVVKGERARKRKARRDVCYRECCMGSDRRKGIDTAGRFESEYRG